MKVYNIKIKNTKKVLGNYKAYPTLRFFLEVHSHMQSHPRKNT